MSSYLKVLLPLLLVLLDSPARATVVPHHYDLISGSERTYVVEPGDHVWSITGRFTMNVHHFLALNTLADPDRLRPGMHLRISDRHIVPRPGSDGIVIDLAARTLYWFENGRLRAAFPVGIGRMDWATPPGRYRIVGRREDPIWRVPAAIQAEMRARGEKVLTSVDPGPDNPLGKYWIQLSAPGFGLHGTNSPGSVGKYATHGCLRLRGDDIELLYHEARTGTPVEIVWEPVKLHCAASGHVYLEVHNDVYRGKSIDPAEVAAVVAAAGLDGAVDWARVTEVAGRAWGTPEDVTARLLPDTGSVSMLRGPVPAARH